MGTSAGSRRTEARCVFKKKKNVDDSFQARLPVRGPPGHRLRHRGQRRIPQPLQSQQQMHLVHHRESLSTNRCTVTHVIIAAPLDLLCGRSGGLD